MRNKIKFIVILLLMAGIAKSQNDSNKITAPATPQVYNYVEQMPTFQGGQDAMFKYLSTNLKYPEDARKNNIQGKVFVKFVVNEDGKVSNANIIRGFGNGFDEEALRVIKEMPDWNPGKQNGKAVAVQYTLPIQFKLADDDNVSAKTPEVMPSFPGGNEALLKYLIDKLNYPKSAQKNNIEGKVIVSFVVNEKGKLEDIVVKKSLDKDCDKEAIRVVKKMPKWKPGIMDGKPVKVSFNLPINFKMQ